MVLCVVQPKEYGDYAGAILFIPEGLILPD